MSQASGAGRRPPGTAFVREPSSIANQYPITIDGIAKEVRMRNEAAMKALRKRNRDRDCGQPSLN